VSSLIQSVTRSFTGEVQLEDQPVAVSVGFSDGVVHLRLGGDSVGEWPAEAVEFVPLGEGSFELTADGDAIVFRPHQPSAFNAFLHDNPSSERPPDDGSDEPANAPLPAATPASSPDQPGLLEPTAADLPPGDPVGTDWPEPAFWGEPTAPLLGEGEGEGGAEPESLLSWESEPDEYFAAGLNGPHDDGPAFSFGSRPKEPDPLPPDPSPAPQQEVDWDALRWHQPEPDATSPTEPPTDLAPGPATEMTPPADSGVIEETEVESPEGAVADLGDESPGEDAEASAVDPEPSILSLQAAEDDFESEPASPDTVNPAGATRKLSLGQVRAWLGKRQASAGGEATDGEDADAGFFKPDVVDDTENLRQWIVVVAGGLAAVALLTIVVLGLGAVLSSDEPPAEASSTTAAPAPSAAPVVTTTTVGVAPASSIVETTSSFVDDWNALARTYAFNLAIEADGMPVSAQAGPFIHLTYDEAGTLTLDMSPQGSGVDRDLLVAMGMAVAYAEPNLSPEERKDVLGVLGVDVANPDLGEVGGEVTRGVVSYRASVIDGLIRFSVTTGP
jgi:hypothetical protein